MEIPNKTRRNLEKLRALVTPARSVLIVLQNNPDPDAIGAALGLRRLVHHLNHANVTIAHGGVVARAENRALVDYLRLPLRQIQQLDPRAFDLVALIDTQPGAGNNALPPGIEPHVIIDHHPARPESRKAPFHDIRRNYGATATIIAEYLHAAEAPIDTPLATALLYAIRSDTQDLGSEACRADVAAIELLFPQANKRMLSQIQRGQVTRDYWRMLADALRHAHAWPGAILTWLGHVQNPDMIAEVADLLLRDEKTHWTLACGVQDDTLLLSIRTDSDHGHANRVIRAVVGSRGTAGGHEFRAGGQIPLKSASPTRINRLRESIRCRFLAALDLPDTPGQPLTTGALLPEQRPNPRPLAALARCNGNGAHNGQATNHYADRESQPTPTPADKT